MRRSIQEYRVDETDATNRLIRSASRTLNQQVAPKGPKLFRFVVRKIAGSHVAEIELAVVGEVGRTHHGHGLLALVVTPVASEMLGDQAA